MNKRRIFIQDSVFAKKTYIEYDRVVLPLLQKKGLDVGYDDLVLKETNKFWENNKNIKLDKIWENATLSISGKKIRKRWRNVIVIGVTTGIATGGAIWLLSKKQSVLESEHSSLQNKIKEHTQNFLNEAMVPNSDINIDKKFDSTIGLVLPPGLSEEEKLRVLNGNGNYVEKYQLKGFTGLFGIIFGTFAARKNYFSKPVLFGDTKMFKMYLQGDVGNINIFTKTISFQKTENTKKVILDLDVDFLKYYLFKIYHSVYTKENGQFRRLENVVRFRGFGKFSVMKETIDVDVRTETIHKISIEKVNWDKRVIKEMATGILRLHNIDVVHRDIKLSNFLFYKVEDEHHAKLIDLECSRMCKTEDYVENVQKNLHEEGESKYLQYCMDDNYTKKSDVYCFGVVVENIVKIVEKRINRNEEFKVQLNMIVGVCKEAKAKDRWDMKDIVDNLK